VAAGEGERFAVVAEVVVTLAEDGEVLLVVAVGDGWKPWPDLCGGNEDLLEGIFGPQGSRLF